MSTTATDSSNRALRLLSKLGPFIALIALLVIFRIALAVGDSPSDFWSATNLRIILVQTSIVAIAACGMTMIIVSGGIDLSVGSVIALSSVAAGLTLHHGGDPLLAIAVAIAAGMVAGALNGSLIAAFGLAPFIVTLGMMGVARGSAKLFADSSTVSFPTNWLGKLMQPIPFPNDPTIMKVLVVAPGVWLAALTAVGMALLMHKSVFGRNAYAIGSNEAAARLCGVRVRTNKIAIYALAGALFGLSGLLMTSQQGQGNPTIALGMELDVIAAVVIGGASLSGGVGRVPGTVVGVLIIGVLRNGLNLLSISPFVQQIVIGVVIALAVMIDVLQHRSE
jgi:ribose transport system permease protein